MKELNIIQASMEVIQNSVSTVGVEYFYIMRVIGVCLPCRNLP